MKAIALTPDQFQQAVGNLMEISDALGELPALPLSSLDKASTLIISVDMNNGFAKFGAMSSDRVGEMIPDTKRFIDACLTGGYEVVAFTDCHEPDAPELKAFPPHCLAGDPESELVDEIKSIPTVYPKNSTNAFYAGGEALIRDSIANYVVTGCCTDICIFQYVMAMKTYLNHHNLSGNIIVPLSLVETYDGPGHNASLFNLVFAQSMIQNGIQVVADIG